MLLALAAGFRPNRFAADDPHVEDSTARQAIHTVATHPLH